MLLVSRSRGEFGGARDPIISRRLAALRISGEAVQSLRRGFHAQDRTCWLHGKE
jgi:hypothetical protein